MAELAKEREQRNREIGGEKAVEQREKSFCCKEKGSLFFYVFCCFLGGG